MQPPDATADRQHVSKKRARSPKIEVGARVTNDQNVSVSDQWSPGRAQRMADFSCLLSGRFNHSRWIDRRAMQFDEYGIVIGTSQDTDARSGDGKTHITHRGRSLDQRVEVRCHHKPGTA